MWSWRLVLIFQRKTQDARQCMAGSELLQVASQSKSKVAISGTPERQKCQECGMSTEGRCQKYAEPAQESSQ